MIWSSHPWSARLVPAPAELGLTAVSRAVAEAIFEVSAVNAETKRVVLEVLATVPFETPTANVLVRRSSAEVLGLAAEFIGRHAVASRVTLEAITSFALAHRGFKVPNLAVDAVSVALAVDLDVSDAGYLGLVDTDGRGYTLSWDEAAPDTITERWVSTAGVVSATFPAPSGRLIRSFVLPIGVGALSLTDLGTVRPPDAPKAGVLREILVWNRGISGEERLYTENYLRCKWIPETCDGFSLTPGQQQAILDGLIASDPANATGGNPAWGDLLDDMRADDDWLAFVDCAEAEMVDNDATPFRRLNPASCAPNCWRAYSIIYNTVPEFRASDPAAAAQGFLENAQAMGVTSEFTCAYYWPVGSGSPYDGEATWGFPPECGRFNNPTTRVGPTDPDTDPWIYMTMEEFVDWVNSREVPCLAFSSAGQTIIDSAGYLGEIPPGMTPTEP